MATFKEKRKKMETLIYDTFSALDPTGTNTEKYKSMFSKMTDTEFNSFFKKFFKDENMYLILDIVNYERDVTIGQIEKAAKVLGIPLFEKVAMPFITGDKEHPVLSKQEVPVGYVHMKRMQQIRSKKNGMSTDITTRSAITGQITGKDKNGRESDAENFGLVTLNADAALREFMGPRADDMVMKTEMYAKIAKDGYVSLSDLTSKLENKTTLNTVDAFFIGMGIKTDLVTEGLVLRKTLDD